ncbi:MAG TPA: MFS transporter [Candidatus Acidoferrum sp.]|nr:MFS transporter [Candidatus Acidoferrum sp.]
MASHTSALPSPTPVQVAKAIAGAVPSELSQSPLVGILGVVLGAGIVTLTGRMLTLGTADLKGSLGIGFDDGAWIGSAFNVALMFIGPFTVYLGGVLGARRVLLIAASLFTLICALLPFVHNYSLLITALVLAGLTSGTFYPLTLTFALRNIPPRFLPFTLALYATFVDAAVNIAPSLYGWYRDHLSFQWMFWNSAVLTPLMVVCIYCGIPAAPPAQRKGQPPSFAGFLYASAGFALLFAALDQGQRLDWWRSGLFNALISGAAIFLLSSLVRRLRMPNPLVDLPYLRLWNTQVLGFMLMLFRFSLLATIILIPQTLAIHGFEADQIGPAVLWTALPQFVIAFIAALLLLQGLDSRLLMAAGFTCMAAAAILNAQFTSAWSAQNFYRTELLMGVGQSFAFIGLVSTIVLQAIFTGGLSKPQAALTFSAFFHIIRLLGGQIGVAYMTHFIAVRERVHSNLLGLHVQKGTALTDSSLGQLTAGLYGKSTGLATAGGRAAGLLSARLRLQAYTLTFIDGFHLVAWGCVAALLLIALLRKSPLNYKQLGFQDAEATPPREVKS